MSLLDNKKTIEHFFKNNWSYTTIHWSGTEFNITGLSEWVRLVYKPRFISSGSISNDRDSSIGTIKFAIFAKTEFRVLELTDLLIELFKYKKLDTNFVGRVTILGTGVTSDNQYNYADIEITLTTY